MTLKFLVKGISALKIRKIYNVFWFFVKMQQQAQTKMPVQQQNPTNNKPVSQMTTLNNSVQNAGLVNKNPQMQNQMQPMKKPLGWWFWMLVGLVVGVLGSWVYYTFLI